MAAVAVDPAADPAPLGFSRKFSVEYGLGWVFWWVWTVFGLGLIKAGILGGESKNFGWRKW